MSSVISVVYVNKYPTTQFTESTARRFAAIDLEAWRSQTSRALDRSDTEEPAYTPGVRVRGARELSPIERVRLEGRFQCFLEGDAAVVQMPDTETSPKSAANFIRKAYHQTGARRILVLALTT